MDTGSEREARGSAAGQASSEAGAESAATTTGAAPHVSRAPAFIRRSRSLHISWQVGVFVVGLAVIAAGAAMLVLPGPGWVAIFAGLAIWATEFAWAHLVLHWTKRKVTEAAQKALDPKVRRRNIILTTAGLVIAGALIGFYLWKYGLTMPWDLKDQ